MSKIIDTAAHEIGITESPAGSNMSKYGHWFGFDGNEWCGMFVSWVYAMAGFSLGNIGFLKGFAGVPTAFEHFVKTGELVDHSKVKPGDIVMFSWHGNGKMDHVGIFERDNGDGTFTSIEGNTSVGNNSNGGCVMRRKRVYSDPEGHQIAYFAHPKVLDAGL